MPGYQEGSREIEIEHRRMPFKDIEAQKIREDVTIQVRHNSYKKKYKFILKNSPKRYCFLQSKL